MLQFLNLIHTLKVIKFEFLDYMFYVDIMLKWYSLMNIEYFLYVKIEIHKSYFNALYYIILVKNIFSFRIQKILNNRTKQTGKILKKEKLIYLLLMFEYISFFYKK